MQRGLKIATVRHAGHTDGGALAQGLDHHTLAEHIQNFPLGGGQIGAGAHDEVVGHRQARAAEHGLCQALVHGHGAAVNAAANVGQVENLQEALNGAIFAGRSVQSGKHHIRAHVGQRPCRAGVEFEQRRPVTGLIQPLGDLRG